MRAFLDANVLVRHLTGDPPAQAAQATKFLAEAEELLLLDVIVAEVVYVLESVYRLGRDGVAALIRSSLAFPTIVVLDAPLLLRALEIYEIHRIDFAEAYIVAGAEAAGLPTVASFDRTIDRVGTVERIEPGV